MAHVRACPRCKYEPELWMEISPESSLTLHSAPEAACHPAANFTSHTDDPSTITINNGVSLPSPVDSGCVYLDILNGYKSFPDRVQNQNFTESSNLVRAQPTALAWLHLRP